MAKKQTFADKSAKVKDAGMEHCPVCTEVMHPTKIRAIEFVNGRMKNTFKMEKICKCNTAAIYG